MRYVSFLPDCMRRTQAIALRQRWLAEGNQPCEHPIASLERTEADYLTGNLVCTTCGSEFRRLSQPGLPVPSEEEAVSATEKTSTRSRDRQHTPRLAGKGQNRKD